MVKYFSADYVIPITAQPIKNGVVAVDEKGKVIQILDIYSLPQDVVVENFEGILIPGFVNAHCHLELSHMRGKLPEKQGLVKFIEGVMSTRKEDEETVLVAMREADKLMYDNGIQAVGDHVNTTASAVVKSESQIKYHTFVEIFGLNDDEITAKIDEARDVEYSFSPQSTSITIHAPYSSSKKMLKGFKKSVSDDNIISIHNQESEEENKLFRYKTGDFIGFYERIGYSLDNFKAQARNSIQTYLTSLPAVNKTLLVHNTFTSLKDLDFIKRMNKDVVFCLCPKANLYIEDTLPKVHILLQESSNIALGTDSLASNDSLSILDELKVLHAAYEELDFLETIKWATINGAKALGLDDNLGSIEVGKCPGLVLLKNMSNFRLNDNVEVQRVL